MRAGVTDHRAAEREKAALVVERKLQSDRLIAALVVAGKGLRALAGPFHRAAKLLCRPNHQRELRIEGVARAVVAADVAAFDPDVGHRHAEDGGELMLLADHAAGPGVQRMLVGRRIVDADRGARVERHAGDALHPGVELRHMGRARECRFGRLDVADIGIDTDIGSVIVKLDVRLRRARCFRHCLKRFVIHPDLLGGILGGGDALRHHHDDLLADVADPVGR